ncbi:hypothetical protein JY462_24540 [Serratia marcescens]|nr:hypothetical protein [Serratia marcescens]
MTEGWQGVGHKTIYKNGMQIVFLKIMYKKEGAECSGQQNLAENRQAERIPLYTINEKLSGNK